MDKTKNTSEETSGGSLGLSTLVVSLGTLSSRIFGLVRDISIAYVFGATRVTDIFFVAYQIPSMFRKLLGEGALSSSVVPVYTDILNNRGAEAARKLAHAAFTWAILAVGGIVALGIVFSNYLVALIAPGFWGTPQFPLAVSLTRVMFPFLLMMSAAAVVMGLLHARDRYAPSAFAPALMNLSLIASIWGLARWLGTDPTEQVWALAVGVLVGGFLQFFIQWLALRGEGLHLRWLCDWKVPGLGRIVKMMGPMAFGLAISQLIVLVDKMVASFLAPGNISYLYFSNRLFQFPFALVGIAVGTVVLPTSSRHVSRQEMGKVVRTARDSLRMMSFLMIPAALGLWLIGHPLIGLLFRSGEFGLQDQNVTFVVLVFALLGLFAYGGIRIFISICYSFEDTKGPVIAAAIALLINAVGDVIFVWAWPVETYRVAGLTTAGSLAVWVQMYVLRRRLKRHLPAASLFPWRHIGKYLLISILMAAALMPLVFSPISELLKVVLGSAGGAALYFGLVYLAGDSYPKRMLNMILRELKEQK